MTTSPCPHRKGARRAWVLMLVLAGLCLPGARCQPAWGDDFRRLRGAMVAQQLAARGIKDPSTLAAMGAVERHRFVPPRLADEAYADRPLPIGHGQTISQPYIVAYMTEALRLAPHSRVLEIGTGSGYQAAVLAAMGHDVFTIEIIAPLADSAARRLEALGYRAVHTRTADGFYGWPEASPFDAIIVTAAAEYVPPPLLHQLRPGGRMVIPVGSPFLVQTLMCIEQTDGAARTTALLPVRFVPLTRAGE